ncbi:hypothetical protein FDB68_07020 [Clostridium botulinum]|nr:hypothetical protein [Clostridium botulinum]NFN51550.1 hypothetical protein [Clostridium botulinum]NFO27511.1 hypothetical protein [Clostridium botulinum]
MNWTTLSVFIAVAAFLISLCTFLRSKKITEKTLNKKFFDDIFSDYLTKKIPEKLSKIERDRDLIKINCEEFEKIINRMLDDALFYKYFEKNFYKKIKEVIVKIDEKLILIPNGNISTAIFNQYNDDLHVLVEELYKELKIYYSGI